MADKTVSLSMKCYDTCGSHATIVYGGTYYFGTGSGANSVTQLTSGSVSQNTSSTGTTVTASDTIAEVAYGNTPNSKHYWGKYTNSAGSTTGWVDLGTVSGSMAERTEFYLTIKFSTGIASITVDGTKYEKSGGDKTLPFNKDKTVSVSVAAETGYNVNSSSYSSSYAMNADRTCQPTASKKTYKLTLTFSTGIASISVSIAGGTASSYTSAPSGGISITHGQKVVCTATASSGYTLNSGSSSKTWDSVTGNISWAPTATENVVTPSYSEPTVTVHFYIESDSLGISWSVSGGNMLPASVGLTTGNGMITSNSASGGYAESSGVIGGPSSSLGISGTIRCTNNISKIKFSAAASGGGMLIYQGFTGSVDGAASVSKNVTSNSKTITLTPNSTDYTWSATLSW